jgi:[ribosomal protein S18]-alanine N-acetyltransferase
VSERPPEQARAAEIVTLTTAHVDELMAHERDMFGAESWSAAAYREEIADKRRRHYLAAVDGAGVLLGWGGVRVIGDEAEILTVGVIPAARRRGIGTLLLDALLEHARHDGAEFAFLDVRVDNSDAQRIYERAGFISVGRRRGYYDNGRTDSLTMSARLIRDEVR